MGFAEVQFSSQYCLDSDSVLTDWDARFISSSSTDLRKYLAKLGSITLRLCWPSISVRPSIPQAALHMCGGGWGGKTVPVCDGSWVKTKAIFDKSQVQRSAGDALWWIFFFWPGSVVGNLFNGLKDLVNNCLTASPSPINFVNLASTTHMAYVGKLLE